MGNKIDIDIIGGGPSGLGVAYYAKKYGLTVKIHESSGHIGGNCKTIVDGDFRYDTGAHRFHDKNQKVTSEIKSLLGTDLLLVTSPSKISFNGKIIDFPLQISNIFFNLPFNIIIKVIFENIINRIIKSNKPRSFRDLAYQNYGKTLSKLFLLSYTEKLWGESVDKHDPTIAGGRFKMLNLKSLLKSFIYSKNYKPKHLEGDFYYPRLGFGDIFYRMGKYIDFNNINLNSSITRINHNGNIIQSIENNKGEKTDVNSLVCTMPLDRLVRSMHPKPPEDILEVLDNLKYRSIMICVIYLNRKSFSLNASLYFPDSNCPFTRIYEPKNRSKEMAPSNKTCIVVEVPIGKNNIRYNVGKSVVYAEVLEYLVDKNMIQEDDIIKYKIVSIKYAYPIITKGIKNILFKVNSYFDKFENLKLIGRSTSFEYLHTHHIMDRSEKLVNKMVS